MSDQGGAAAERVRGYLLSQLRRNPQVDSMTIVERRARALGLDKRAKPARDAGVDRSAQRQRSLQVLEQVRSAAFQAPVAQLLEQLDNLELSHFPDLQMLERRLRTMVECRQSLPPLTSHRHFNGDFWACLKQVLTSPPREVAVLREQVIASFQSRINRRRGKAMIKLLKTHLPQLYALEGEWLDTMLRFQPRTNTSGEGGGDVGEMIAANWLVIPVAAVLIVVIVGVIAAFDDGKSSPRKSRQVVVPPDARPLAIPQHDGHDPFATAEATEETSYTEHPAGLARRRREERMRERQELSTSRATDIVNDVLRDRAERRRRMRGDSPDHHQPEVEAVDAGELERKRQEAIEAQREKLRAQMERWNRQGGGSGTGPGPSSPEAGTTAPFATPRVAPVVPQVPAPRP